MLVLEVKFLTLHGWKFLTPTLFSGNSADDGRSAAFSSRVPRRSSKNDVFRRVTTSFQDQIEKLPSRLERVRKSISYRAKSLDNMCKTVPVYILLHQPISKLHQPFLLNIKKSVLCSLVWEIVIHSTWQSTRIGFFHHSFIPTLTSCADGKQSLNSGLSV